MSQNIFEKITQKFVKFDKANRPKVGDFPQWMRRCFMTGKQCIFCPQDTVFEGGADGKIRDSVFVIMPFRPNLDTFYEWSLKPYLASFGINPHRIRRADQFTNTGYVMCEKICLRIQQAGLIIIDLSLKNPNVYYELGIAVGLNKPLLTICDKDRWSTNIEHLCAAVGIDPKCVLLYPNVGRLDKASNDLLDFVNQVSLLPRSLGARIGAVLVREDHDGRKNDEDISVNFQRALEAAVGVAVRKLHEKADNSEEKKATRSKSSSLEMSALGSAFVSLSEDGLNELTECKHEYLTIEANIPQPFEKIARLVDGSLISIVDLASENALAYFWLGYCHARNINVVPIYRHLEKNCNGAEHQTTSQRADSTAQHVLAFDIRALWYMNHTPQVTKDLANKLAAVLEPILVRDITTQQRRIFWERLTRSGRVYIYNGAVHHRELNREVVGDWDLRTASELISYLSSTDESVVPVLQSPIYSPETIAEKLQLEQQHKQNLTADYVDLVRKELSGKNCLILGSADVNPITEVVLAAIYDSWQKGSNLACFCGSVKNSDDATVIAIKGEPSPQISGTSKQAHTINSVMPFQRRFSRTTKNKKRGFLIDGKPHEAEYYSQDQSEKLDKSKKFWLFKVLNG